MTNLQYRRVLKRLGLSVFGAGPILGVTGRQSQRFASGESAIPETMAKLIAAYLRHGLPDAQAGAVDNG